MNPQRGPLLRPFGDLPFFFLTARNHGRAVPVRTRRQVVEGNRFLKLLDLSRNRGRARRLKRRGGPAAGGPGPESVRERGLVSHRGCQGLVFVPRTWGVLVCRGAEQVAAGGIRPGSPSGLTTARGSHQSAPGPGRDGRGTVRLKLNVFDGRGGRGGLLPDVPRRSSRADLHNRCFQAELHGIIPAQWPVTPDNISGVPARAGSGGGSWNQGRETQKFVVLASRYARTPSDERGGLRFDRRQLLRAS